MATAPPATTVRVKSVTLEHRSTGERVTCPTIGEADAVIRDWGADVSLPGEATGKRPAVRVAVQWHTGYILQTTVHLPLVIDIGTYLHLYLEDEWKEVSASSQALESMGVVAHNDLCNNLLFLLHHGDFGPHI